MDKVKNIRGCDGCPLQAKFPENNFVPVKLGSSLRLVVAEAPGETESAMGEPLVGSSGKIFDSLAKKAGLSRDSLTIINTINCRPPNNFYPTDNTARSYCTEQEAKDAVSQCYRAHVKPIINSRPWTRIDALGEKALRALTGKTDGIMKWRGSPLALVGEAIPRVIGTLHPSYLMRDQAMIPAVVSDLKKGTVPPPENYNLNPTLDDLEAFTSPFVVFDIETNRFTNQITMVGIASKPYNVLVVPFRGAYLSHIKRIFANATEIVGQNIIGFDLPMLKTAGVEVSETAQIWDTMLMQHLVQPDMPHDLEFIASIFTQKPAWKHLNREDMALYNARDVDVTTLAFSQLKPLLRMLKLEELYKYTQVPLAKICNLMHETGIRTDGNRVKDVRVKLDAEVEELQHALPTDLQPYDKAIKKRVPAPPGTLGKSGKPIKFLHVPSTERVIPWNSPKLVEKYLYETLKLPKQVHAKTKKISTDKNSLAKLIRKTQHPALKALLRLRQVDELRTTFLKEGTVGSGRVHTHFAAHGTNSGRLSSSGPNLQNLNPTAKYIYVPSHPDWVFVEGDFSSLENRLTALYANDFERLNKLSDPHYNEHKEATSNIFGIPIDKINKDMPEYRLGKASNHAANYGLGPRKFAIMYDIPEKEARDILLKWKLANPITVQWQESTSAIAAREGYLTTKFGRKRWFWTSSTYTESLSFLPQSTGADISFRAMISLMYERVGWSPTNALKVCDVLSPLPWPAKLIAQVHDSLLVECPLALVDEVVKAMSDAMTQKWKDLGGYSIPVEFKVGGSGDSWAELKPYKLES